MHRRAFLALASLASLLSWPQESEAALDVAAFRLQATALLTGPLGKLTLEEITLCERAQTEEMTDAEWRAVRKLARKYLED
mgnify:CR=1 FL=1